VLIVRVKVGFEVKTKPTLGLKPAFLLPPQLGLLIIDAAFRAILDPFM
jgi:hypothetical protein